MGKNGIEERGVDFFIKPILHGGVMYHVHFLFLSPFP